MQAQTWEAAYDRFLEQCREAGDLEPWAGEHRAHPRFRLLSNVVWTAGEFQFSIVDLSISGIAFDSNFACEAGRELVVRLSDLISVRAQVVGTSKLEPTPMFIAGRYRARCRFVDEVEGLRFLVMVKDMKALRIDL